MSNKFLDSVNFDIIRYANCWEDADILLEGLNPQKGAKILSIASAGDNCLSLLTSEPQLLVAVDLNATQLYLLELKIEAIRNLKREEVLQFLGFIPCDRRLEIFNLIKSRLTKNTEIFWQQNEKIINEGLIYAGKFEKYFKLFSQKILPFIHSRNTCEILLSKKSQLEQINFYDNNWNSKRWKLLFKLFFSRIVMGKIGRDPQFLKHVKVDVADTIYQKAAKHLSSIAAQENFMLRFTLTGNFGDQLPHYLRAENFDIIKSHLDKILIRKGYIQDNFKEFGTFSVMNLSNIFEYMDETTFNETIGKLINGLDKNGRMAYWNLMVQRKAAIPFPLQLHNNSKLSNELSARDKGFFYDHFYIDEKL